MAYIVMAPSRTKLSYGLYSYGLYSYGLYIYVPVPNQTEFSAAMYVSRAYAACPMMLKPCKVGLGSSRLVLDL